jgi:hypothetical protein
MMLFQIYDLILLLVDTQRHHFHHFQLIETQNHLEMDDGAMLINQEKPNELMFDMAERNDLKYLQVCMVIVKPN